jgi:hypothetical protein
MKLRSTYTKSDSESLLAHLLLQIEVCTGLSLNPESGNEKRERATRSSFPLLIVLDFRSLVLVCNYGKGARQARS